MDTPGCTELYTALDTDAFDAVLIANRGEIAARIVRSARALGLRSIAVYSDADAGTPHTLLADEAVHLAGANPYLDVELIIQAAIRTGAGAIHPGYGFLSENAGFAKAVAAAGMTFVGPTPEHLELFGDKHSARLLAGKAGVPMLAGSGLLDGIDQAVAEAARIGYPVMLKATSGGGGIGLRVCAGEPELREAYETVRRSAEASFGSAEVFLERFVTLARHVEVQVFGDGHGRVVSLGDRDCSVQRRNQKIVEEAPAPDLPDDLRAKMHQAARELCASVQYRSAGTVEFVYDPDRQEIAFLEVNTRLQVEHPVTEEITGIDLVAWMLRQARGEDVLAGVPDAFPIQPRHAVEARLYAEDPVRDFQPSPGLVTHAEFPAAARVDSWIETGLTVSPSYDPLLAKIITSGDTREQAYERLSEALAGTRIDGIQTNLGLLRAISRDLTVHTTSDEFVDSAARIEVLRAGTSTTIQDWPGRTGYWQVGVPPSGPMDDRSFRLGNQALGNHEGAPGLECTLEGPRLRFTEPTRVCVTGAPAEITVNGTEVQQWEPIELPAGAVLDVGTPPGHGMRTYVLIGGGFDVPEYLGSAATFTAGGFGGHGGRALRIGDVLRPGAATMSNPKPVTDIPEFKSHWDIEVSEGPHGAPDFLTREGLTRFYATEWTVHTQSARNGVRLNGPKQLWARADGGEAGLHPSNVHDTAYSIGAVNVSGETPVLLGPDGPSLGGFICPVTVVSGSRWKIGQLRPGDTIRFVPVPEPTAAALHHLEQPRMFAVGSDDDDGVLLREGDVTYRRSGHDNILVEYGPMTLDLGLRMRVHALMSYLQALNLPGIVDVTPGVRSLHVHTDPDVLPLRTLLGLLHEAERELPPAGQLSVPSREIWLPLSFDDPSIHEAISRYQTGVRDNAPWNPDNIEFIRRINGLATVQDVREIVFAASYLVLGLGDVYLGAPAATPLDPRHRLVTTKYNPARTWTPEGGVGIGGAYMCVYGMESPGGYQLIGRTVPIWSGLRQYGPFEAGVPWLLRFFDRVRFYPVAADELLDIRADLKAGRAELRVQPGEFVLADHNRFLADNAEGIAKFRAMQNAAFEAEKQAWQQAGEFDPRPEPDHAEVLTVDVPDGASLVSAQLSASVWRIDVRPGETVTAGQIVLRLEAMKLEVAVRAPVDGVVADILVTPGQHLTAGHALMVIAGQEAA
jgi:urea carboxylase